MASPRRDWRAAPASIPTTFNKSKRISRDGRPRWPSTESISKILEATGATMSEFVGYIGTVPSVAGAMRRVPVIGYAQAGEKGFFDDAGYPTGAGWDELLFPELADTHAYALMVAGDSMEPVYRDGDTIVVSPQASLASRRPLRGQDHDGRSDGKAADPQGPAQARAYLAQRGARRTRPRSVGRRLLPSHPVGQPVRSRPAKDR